MFVVLKKSRVVFALALVVLVACASVIAVWGAGEIQASAVREKTRKIPVYAVDTEQSSVAISFDAAWGGDKTEKILDILDEYEVKATFFLVGFWIDAFPELVREIHARGHAVGNHSENHPHVSGLSKEEIRREITSVNEKIERLIGESPVFFRAPYGEYNDTLMTVLEELGMTGVQWSVDSLDWKGLSGGQIADRVVPKAQKGSIILCHNNSDHVLDALPIVLMGLKNKNLLCVRMDQLVLTKDYYVDNNGTQHTATTE